MARPVRLPLVLLAGCLCCGCGPESDSVNDLPEPPTDSATDPARRDSTARAIEYHLSCIPTDDLGARRQNAEALRQQQRIRLYEKPAVDLGPDPDWSIDPFDSRTWRYQLHAFLWMWDLLAVALADRDPGYVETARVLLSDWVRDNRAAPSSDMVWHDHATPLRANAILAYLAAGRTLGVEDLDRGGDLEAMLDEHARRLAEESFYSRHTNHGFDQARSLLLLALRSGHEDAARWSELGDARLTDELEFAFTDDGVHKENSPDYHLRMLDLLVSTRELDAAFGLEGRGIDPLVQKALRFLAAVVQPDGFLPMIGDTYGHEVVDIEVPEWVEGRDEIRFALKRGAEGRKSEAPDLMLPDSGYVVLRDGWHSGGKTGVHVVVKGAALATYHFHDDIQSFTLWAHGERFVVDPGLFAYEYDDPRRIHMTGRRAHNVVLVDDGDRSRPVSVIPSTFVATRSESGRASCTSDFRHEDGTRSVRTIDYTRGDRLVIRDRITSADGSPIDCRQVFHIDRHKRVDPVEGGFVISSLREGGPTLRIVGDGGRSWSTRGQAEPFLQGWASYGPLRIDPVDVVGFEKSGVTVEFETVLTFTTQPSRSESR